MGDVQGVICAGGNYPRRKLSGFNYLGANFLSGNYVGGGEGNCPRWELYGGNCPGGGDCPVPL